MKIHFRKKAVRQFKKLEAKNRVRILKKLEWFSNQSDPLFFAEPISEAEVGQYRFRIGDYRVVFDIKENIIIVLDVGHRREIYR